MSALAIASVGLLAAAAHLRSRSRPDLEPRRSWAASASAATAAMGSAAVIRSPLP